MRSEVFGRARMCSGLEGFRIFPKVFRDGSGFWESFGSEEGEGQSNAVFLDPVFVVTIDSIRDRRCDDFVINY